MERWKVRNIRTRVTSTAKQSNTNIQGGKHTKNTRDDCYSDLVQLAVRMENCFLCAPICIRVPLGVGPGGRRHEDVLLRSRLWWACIAQLVVDAATDEHSQHNGNEQWHSNPKPEGYVEPAVMEMRK